MIRRCDGVVVLRAQLSRAGYDAADGRKFKEATRKLSLNAERGLDHPLLACSGHVKRTVRARDTDSDASASLPLSGDFDRLHQPSPPSPATTVDRVVEDWASFPAPRWHRSTRAGN